MADVIEFQFGFGAPKTGKIMRQINVQTLKLHIRRKTYEIINKLLQSNLKQTLLSKDLIYQL